MTLIFLTIKMKQKKRLWNKGCGLAGLFNLTIPIHILYLDALISCLRRPFLQYGLRRESRPYSYCFGFKTYNDPNIIRGIRRLSKLKNKR